MVASANRLLSDNVRVLKSHVSRTAWQGVFTAATSIVVATLLVSLYETGSISANGIIQAQSDNYALWVLDLIPFIFGFWGQYSSSIIAYEAGALVFDQTNELRNKAEKLEKEANYAVTHDSLTELKIDQSFVQDILTNENDVMIVNATINLAHNLGLQVTAEGVESKEVMDKLKSYGCDIIQGYYISKPISAAKFTQWMQNQTDGQTLKPSSVDEQPENLQA